MITRYHTWLDESLKKYVGETSQDVSSRKLMQHFMLYSMLRML